MNRILYENLIQYILTNQQRFYRLAYSYTRNQEDALDAVQNAVCKALEAYENIRNTGAIKTWFYRILVNESLQILKQRKKDAPIGEETLFEVDAEGYLVITFPAGTVTDAANGIQSFRIQKVGEAK